MFSDITIEELLDLRKHREITLIDVRSPQEYADFTIPGSLNIPLFDDQERKEVGTLYTQVSVQVAKDKGLELVSAKLPSFIKRFEALPGRRAVFCWRGGMRSRTTATVLSLMDIHVYRLTGGIRAYRRWVTETLPDLELRSEAIVLNGYTGTGKTEILQRLADKGQPVLELEALAGHRGSIFGHVGLAPNNQKTFESLLLEQALELQKHPHFWMEAESQRIGKVVLPEWLMAAKDRGRQFVIELPMEERVRNILQQYRPHENSVECRTSFERMRKHIHTPVAAAIDAGLREERYEEAIRLLLEYYYDPRYKHSLSNYGDRATVIRANTTGEAAAQLEAVWKSC